MFTISAFAAGGAAQFTKTLVLPFIDMTKFTGVFLQLIFAGGVAILVYGLLCYLFKSEEIIGFLAALRNRWPFKKVRVDDQGEARGV